MLKKTRVLFLGLVVLAGSACVTPTHASSANQVILTYVQAAGPYGAKDELITIHNNGLVPVDITGWCLQNKASVAFACFDAPAANGYATRFILPEYGSATVASTAFLSLREYSLETVSLAYEVTSQTSGSLVGSADTVILVDADGVERDVFSWTSTAPSYKYWTRTKTAIDPDVYSNTGTAAFDWSAQAFAGLVEDMVLRELVEVTDPEPELEPEIEPETPGQSMSSTIVITEIFPNAAGADAGKEFIELHNTSLLSPASLDGLRLRIGIEDARWYDLPVGFEIPAGGYFILRDTEIGFTLPNSKGGIQLYMGEVAAGERVEYTFAKDDMAWAFLGGVWAYAKPTPGALNAHQPAAPEVKAVQVAQKPCAANQYRNPETGRCKLLSVQSSTPSPCKPGQERNPETNRCRTVAAAKEPTPCKEGQERNPETNRCRGIIQMSKVDYAVKGVQKEAATQLSWYYIAAIVGVVLLVVGYAAWEWRQELSVLVRRLRGAFAQK